MKTIAVIPARYASTRMPGKPLADVLGKPMIWWVYQAAKACPKLDDVLIATDDERIAGFIHIGTPRLEAPERERPDPAELLTDLRL